MAHVREELALGPARGLGLTARLDQLGDIDDVEQDSVVVPAVVDGLNSQNDFGPCERPLEDDGLGARRASELFEVLEYRREDLPLVEVLDLPANDLRPFHPHELAEETVDLDDGILFIGEDDTFVHSRDHGLELGDLPFTSPFGPLSLRDFL